MKANILSECTTAELIGELKRRSAGLLLAQITFDENGDRWALESKGSQKLVESLFFQIERKYMPDEDESDGDVRAPA